MKEITYIGASNGEKSEAQAVLALMDNGNINSKIQKITFDEIPESLEKLKAGKAGSGRFVAIFN